MRLAKSKSTLKNNLQVEMSARLQLPPDVIIVDGCALLWTVHWPSKGTVQNLVDEFYKYIGEKLISSDVYLVFDHYYDYSIKSTTRKERAANLAHRHQFSIATPLPAQDVTLTSTENKVQLINIICEYLVKKVAERMTSKRLIVTGSEDIPQEVHAGVLIKRVDLRTTHEEADVIMIQQCVTAVEEGAKCVKLICDDTDVFVLLVHFTHVLDIQSTILMEATSGKRTVININETVKKHTNIASSILPAHALSGCDSVPQLFGIGKTKVITTLKKNLQTQRIGKCKLLIMKISLQSQHRLFVLAMVQRKN